MLVIYITKTESALWGHCIEKENHHLTCSFGFSQESVSHSIISFWSCNKERHSLYRLQEGKRDSSGSSITSPFQAAQTDPHTVPSVHSERPLRVPLVPGRRASPQPEHGHIKAKRSQAQTYWHSARLKLGLISCRLFMAPGEKYLIEIS